MRRPPFPRRPWWAEHVIQPTDNPKFGNAEFHAYYLAKHEIARAVRPTAIAEIGVRYGYSAWAFLQAAPTASFTGFDRQAGTHGGVKGVDTFPAVEALLERDFPEASLSLLTFDTQQLEALPGGPFDFIHVDGDHSEGGCYHDLELALAASVPGGTILVDDYDYIAGVRRAVDRFRTDHAEQFRASRYVKTLRGDIVLTLAAAESMDIEDDAAEPIAEEEGND